MKLFSRLYLVAFIVAAIGSHFMVGNGPNDRTLTLTLAIMAMATIGGMIVTALEFRFDRSPPERISLRIFGQLCLYLAIDLTYVIDFYVQSGMSEKMHPTLFLCCVFWLAALVAFVLHYLGNRLTPAKG